MATALFSASGAAAATTEPSTTSPSLIESQPGAPDLVTEPGATAAEVAWQQEFDMLNTALGDKYPNQYAVAKKTTSTSGTVSFSGATPVGARSLIGAVAGVTVIENAGFTNKQLDFVSKAAFDVAAETTGEVPSLQTYINWADMTLRVSYDDEVAQQSTKGASVGDAAASSPGPMADAEAVEDAILDEVAIPSAFGLKVEVGGDDVVETQAWDGGDKLWARSGVCTAAFPIKKVNGPEIGVLTAGHCSAQSSYGCPNCRYIFSSPGGSLWTSDTTNGGDMRWLWSSEAFSGRTYIGNSTFRNFSQAARASVSSRVCVFGQFSTPDCANVARTNAFSYATVSPEDGGRTFRVGPLWGMDRRITNDGDSGGPWYYGVTAYGIHHGATDTSSLYTNIFSPLNQFNLQLWRG